MSGRAFSCRGASACFGAIGVCHFDGRFSMNGCMPFLRTCYGYFSGDTCCRRVLTILSLLSGTKLGTLPLRNRG